MDVPPAGSAEVHDDTASSKLVRSSRRATSPATVTAGKIPAMTTPGRRRGKNGAAKRYKGIRELIAARVWPEIAERVDTARGPRTRNDWITAAILVGLDNPDAVEKALQQIDMLGPRPGAGHQLPFGDAEEALDRSA